jgi:integrase
VSASAGKRGDRYYVVDEQREPARRCTQCRPKPRGRSTRTPRGGSRYWVSDLDGAEECPKCGAPLGPPALERRQRSGGTFKLRREAEAAAAELDVSKQRGAYVAPSKVTFGEYLTERWLPAVEHTVRPSTFNSYGAEVELHLIPKLGHVRLRDLGPEHLNRLYGELLRNGRRNGQGGLSPRSVQYCHIVASRALSDAVRWRLVVRNVAKDADPPKPARRAAKFWTPAELRRFVDHDPDDRLQALWTLAATTGARRSELLGLGYPSLDLEAGRMTITRTLVVVDGEPRFSEPKTRASRRTVSLDPATVAVLRQHRARQLRERLELGVRGDDELVFTDVDGKPLDPRVASEAFKQRARRAGLPALSFHGLRHSFAAAAISAGESYKVVQERLGHASPTITLATYSHVSAEAEEAAAHRIAARILGGPPP